jgi:hypothetical protein
MCIAATCFYPLLNAIVAGETVYAQDQIAKSRSAVEPAGFERGKIEKFPTSYSLAAGATSNCGNS